jgi:hypothetical protein
MENEVHIRRVRNPEPFLEQLAQAAVDSLNGERPRPFVLAAVSRESGVPIAYLLDELERRARALKP